MNILIVDDSTQIRKVTEYYLGKLKDFNFCFYHASNGNEAETILQEQRLFDDPIKVVFCDWHMPEKDGLTFLQDLKRSEIFRNEPHVIMLSAETYPHQIQKCIESGAFDYLTKPFTEKEIQNTFLKAFNKINEVKNAV